MKLAPITGTRSWHEIALNSLAVFILYGVVLFITSSFTFEPSSTPLFWPANAIVLVIMLYTTRQRALIYLGSSFLSYFVYLFFYDSFGFVPSCLLSSANIIEILAGYFLICWFASQPIQFNYVKNTIELIVYGVLLNSIIGATVGTIFMAGVWEAPTLINWSIWFGTAAIGNLMVLPLLISWLSPTKRTYNRHEINEMAVLFIFCFVGSILIFSVDKDKPLIYPYVVFPMLLWAGMRFDMRVTSIAFQIFLILSAVMSSQGHGPFAMGEFYREILLIRFHLFCAITIITVLIVSALRNERLELIQELQEAFSKIKTLKGYIPICSYCKKIRDDIGYWNHLEAYIHEHSDAELSHGICPACVQEHFGEYFDSIEEKKKTEE